MEKKVSVIIPFYNTEKYIEKCISSVVSQTYENIEIILVDNESTDASLHICEKIIDKRIRICKCEKRGVSYARNLGINVATGDYILFVDSDDYIGSNMIEKLIGCLSDNCCMSMCNYIHCNEDGQIVKQYNNKDYEMDICEFENNLFGLNSDQYNGYLWNKLFLSKIIKARKIYFHPSISYNEDRLFITEYLSYCNKNNICRYMSEPLYYYLERDNGAIGLLNNNKVNFSKIVSEIIAFEKCEAIVNNKSAREKIVEESVERTIRILRMIKESTKESKYLEGYLKRILGKYKYMFSIREKIKIYIYMSEFFRKKIIGKKYK